MLDPDYLLIVADDVMSEGGKLEDELLELIIIYLAMMLSEDPPQAGWPALDQKLQGFALQAGQIINKVKPNIIQTASETYTQAMERSKNADNSTYEQGIQEDGQSRITPSVPNVAGRIARHPTDSQEVMRLERGGRDKIISQIDKTCSDALTSIGAYYQSVVDRAIEASRSGLVSYSDAIKQAIIDVAGYGAKIRYPSGRTDDIDVAIARAVRTGISQACARVTDQKMDEIGWDIVLVSAHLGARVGDGGDNFTNHYWWQGKFYSRSGNDSRFPPFAVCGMGEIQGLHGVNCRHSHGPGDGIHNPYEQYDSAENRRAYEQQQAQRAQERKIRRIARESAVLKAARDATGDDEQIVARHKQVKKRLAGLRKAYKTFCEDNGLKPQYDRIKAIYN